MKVVYVLRPRRANAHSIEELFGAVAAALERRDVTVHVYRAGGRRAFLRDAWRLRRMGADVYHVTGDVNYFALLLPWSRTVLTVHDVGQYRFSLRGIKRIVYKWVWLIGPMWAARSVTMISETTRAEVGKHVSASLSARAVVIDNCHGAIFRPIMREFQESCPVVLQIGTQPHKNVQRVVEALEGITCRFVIVGHVSSALREELTNRRVMWSNVSGVTHEQIARLYADADVVTFVSTSEGFGVPIIEAQAVGRPVITSNIAPLKDVAGDGACLVDPLSTDEIRAAIVRIIRDKEYRESVKDSGFRNVARFAPGAIADKYLDLYRGIAKTKT